MESEPALEYECGPDKTESVEIHFWYNDSVEIIPVIQMDSGNFDTSSGVHV